jgi:RNA polymerase-binding transcription factor DksA
MKEFLEVRDQLINLLEELDERLDKITDDIRHVEQPPEQDFSEQATESENDEVLDALGNSARLEAEQIKQAISRIDAGTYGICTACGGPIRRERLLALPYASLCIICAEQNEGKQD